MATNKFLPFAAGDDANVMSDDDYANALATNGTFQKGVTTGQASSKQANKAWRQATLMAAAIAQVIVDFGEDANDGMSPEDLASLIRKALLTKTAADSIYATILALNSEITRASTVESNLQSNKVSRSGDTMTGGLTIIDGAGYATDFSPSNPAQGSYVNYPGYASIGSARGVSFGFSAQEHVGTETLGLFTLSGTAVGSPVYWYMHQSGRLGDSVGGNYAYTTEVDKKQAAGDYAVNSDLPLPRGMHQQIFTVSIPSSNGSGGFLVSLPAAFSNFSFCTSCDTGSNVYLTSALPENSGQARIYAKFANGTWATSGLLTITASGYYS